MAIANNFTVRGRLVADPELAYRDSKTTPGQRFAVCNFTVAVNLHDSKGTVLYYKFAAWDNPDKGSSLASDIVNNFRKGEWIGILKAKPARDSHPCMHCKRRGVAYNAFTVYEIDGLGTMDLDDLRTDNELQEEIILNLEDDDGPAY